MQGFDTKALILFPKYENYEFKSGDYKYQFKKAVSNLIKYLESVGIEPHVFYTDDVARDINHPGFKWVSTLSTADRYFVAKNCDNCGNALELPMITFDEVYNKVLDKDPGSLSMSMEERYEMVLRHSIKASSSIIPMYKIVVHFQIPKRAQYKVVSKPNDGRIRIDISANTFAPKVYMSGIEEDACDLLGVPYGNRSLDVWG